jgi:mannitol-1-phosphate/altronate dehydrogenase
VGSIRNVLHDPDGAGDLASQVVTEHYRIISMTVTENGYKYTGTDRHLDVNVRAIAHDLSNPENPWSVIGFLVRVAAIRIDSRLHSELRANGCFPNSMVDRVTMRSAESGRSRQTAVLCERQNSNAEPISDYKTDK